MTQIRRNVRDLRIAFMPEILAQPFSQGINYDRSSVDGSIHQIRLRITILHLMPITRERRRGFSRGDRMRNGSQPVPTHSSGFMENVRPSHSAARRDLITSIICSWLWQEHTLVRTAFAGNRCLCQK